LPTSDATSRGSIRPVEQVLGYTREEVLVRPYLDLVHPDDRERTSGEAAALSQGKDGDVVR